MLKWKQNIPIDREFHALTVAKKRFFSKVDLHLRKSLFSENSRNIPKSEVTSDTITLIAIYCIPLERAFKTAQNGVFEVRISSTSQAIFQKQSFGKIAWEVVDIRTSSTPFCAVLNALFSGIQ